MNTIDTIRQVVTMPQLNDDVEGVITSFLPMINRFYSIRGVYTNEFLEEGLKKKTVAQLTLILQKLIEMVDTGELAWFKYLFQTLGLDIEALKTKKTYTGLL